MALFPKQHNPAAPAPSRCARLFSAHWYRGFLLFVFFTAIAAACLNGFYTKWRLNDGHPAFSLAAMVDGSAHRPYVYRQLLPVIANGIQAMLPPATVARVSARLAAPQRVNSHSGIAMRYPGSESLQVAYALRYHIVYYLTFAALLAALFVMRALCLRLGASAPAAVAAPAAFALLLPFLLTIGGYFYDFTELLFMMSGVLLASRPMMRKPAGAALLLLLGAVATFNKEAFFWFSPTLYPLLRQHLDSRRAAALTAGLLLVCGSVYLALRLRYAGQYGSTADFQLWENLRFYSSLSGWLKTESTYGVLLPRGFSIVTVLLFAGVACRQWRHLALPMRRHATIALAINLPLFLLFCSPGEMRNLSMLYPTWLALTAVGLSGWLARESQPAAPGEPAPVA